MRIEPRKLGVLAAKALAGILPAAAVLAFRPLGLDPGQAVVAAALVLAVGFWTAGAASKALVSGFLLIVFLAFGRTAPASVFRFPLSESFSVIVLAFLVSQGIAKSGLARKLLLPVLDRRAGTPGRLLAAMILSSAAFVFLIPQPFSRVIILSGIFAECLEARGLPARLKERLLFALHLFSALANNLFLRGDLILNPAFLNFSGLSMGESGWTARLLVPGLVHMALALVVFLLMARRDWREYARGAGMSRTEGTGVPASDIPASTPAPPTSSRLSSADRRNLVLIGLILAAWALEGLHGVRGVWIAAAGTGAMFVLGLLEPRDLKAVNPGLLLFLTAASSIGAVLEGSGTAARIFPALAALLPRAWSPGLALGTVGVSMAGHMVLGSNMTTLSVLVPAFRAVGEGAGVPEAVAFLVFVSVTTQFLLPFHHVVLLLGAEAGRYGRGTVFRFGLALTLVSAAAAAILYPAWWGLGGLP